MHPLTEDPVASGMVRVPAGTVGMRDDRRGTRWQTELPEFLLGRYPVTAEVHRAVTGSAPATSGAEPVTGVSWFDAVAACNAASSRAGLPLAYAHDVSTGDVIWDGASDGYRLPTEAEWQYACKAGTTGYRYDETDAIAWYDANSDGRVHEVGAKSPNAWGLHDMLGNVWEWCWDLYDEEVYGAYRIFRGGGWAEPERGCGATVRRRSHPTFAIDDLGYRLARNVP